MTSDRFVTDTLYCPSLAPSAHTPTRSVEAYVCANRGVKERDDSMSARALERLSARALERYERYERYER